MYSSSHIIPLFIGEPKVTKLISDILLDRYRIYVQPINYPTVARGEERLRLSPSPLHTDEMIEKFVQSAKEVWNELELKKLSDYHANPSMTHKFFPIVSKSTKLSFLY